LNIKSSQTLFSPHVFFARKKKVRNQQAAAASIAALLAEQEAARRPNGSMGQLTEDVSMLIQATLQGTNISPKNAILKMIFLFPRVFLQKIGGIYPQNGW